MLCPLCRQRPVEAGSMFCADCEALRLEIAARVAARPLQGVCLDVFTAEQAGEVNNDLQRHRRAQGAP